jgi:hypothetical protein
MRRWQREQNAVESEVVVILFAGEQGFSVGRIWSMRRAHAVRPIPSAIGEAVDVEVESPAFRFYLRHHLGSREKSNGFAHIECHAISISALAVASLLESNVAMT